MDMTEVWIDIKGYDGKYRVSNYGKVYSVLRDIVLKPKTDKDGYHEYCLIDTNGKRKCERGHRLVALMFCAKPKGCNVVNHKNLIKNDNRSINLEWTTIKGNAIHSWENNQSAKDAQRLATLKAQEVVSKTIDVFKDGEYLGRFIGKEKVAQAFGISAKTIYNRLNNRFSSRSGYDFVEVGDDV